MVNLRQLGKVLAFVLRGVVLFAVISMTMAVVGYAASASEYTIQSNVSEVRLAFSATNFEGHTVRNLSPHDVAVVDNGEVIRDFRSFRQAAETPLHLIILLDASGSVQRGWATETAQIQEWIQRTHWGEKDQISLMVFREEKIEIVCMFRCKDADVVPGQQAIRGYELTPLYDALVRAAEILTEFSDAESRQAIMLFSDGADTISKRSLPEALEAAQKIEAAVYTVNPCPQKQSEGGNMVLKTLAELTGGLNFTADKDLQETLSQVVQDLRSGFALTYDLPPDPKPQHWIRILPTADSRLQLRARRGYHDSRAEQ